jgi:hypothetical protein
MEMINNLNRQIKEISNKLDHDSYASRTQRENWISQIETLIEKRRNYLRIVENIEETEE